MITVKAPTLWMLRQQVTTDKQWAVPYAAAAALTQVAENTRMDTIRQMRSKLHMPTDWTINSMWKRPATARDLTAMVYLKDGGGGRRYTDARFPAMGNAFVAAGQDKKSKIGHLFGGGTRQWKAFEGRLLQAGLIPRGMAAVPGDGCPLDAYGNIPRGFIVQMLAYFEAFKLQGDRQNMTDKGRAAFGRKQGKSIGIGGQRVDYFVSRGRGHWYGGRSWKNGRSQHLPAGIWMRVQAFGGTSLKPIILFVKRPSYGSYFDLQAIAQTAMRRDFANSFAFYLNRMKGRAR